MRNKKILYIIFTILVIVGAGYSIGDIMGVKWFTMLAMQPAGQMGGKEQEAKKDGNKDAKKGPALPPPLVVVANPAPLVLPNGFNVPGLVQANQSLAVKSRIDGVISQIFVKDGVYVKKGDKIAQLDDAQYQLQIQQMANILEREQKLLADYTDKMNRSDSLLANGYETKANNDTAHKNFDAQQSLVKSVQNNLSQAQLNLTYTHITAPINGRIGVVNAVVGALVRSADATPLVVINELSPIKIQFAIGQEYLAEAKQAIAKGTGLVNITANGIAKPINAKIIAVDNAIDANTGLVNMRAQSDNSGEQLWHGMNVTVAGQFSATTYPLAVGETAILRANDGEFVYVINNDNKAIKTKVILGKNINGQQILLSGVGKDDKIAIDGLLSLRDGIIVQIKQ